VRTIACAHHFSQAHLAPLLLMVVQELAGLLAEPTLKDIKGLVVLGNKSDLLSSLNNDQLLSALALHEPMEAVHLASLFLQRACS